jgi:membrane-associated phospholipid phosphatase
MAQPISSTQPVPKFSKSLQAFAQTISWIAHPLFIPAYVAAILLFDHPINQLMIPYETRIRIMAMVLINTVLFPGLLVFLLKQLGFLKSIYMSTTKERIIPLTVGIMFYFWAYYVGRNLEVIPRALQQWLLGVFLCSCAAMFTNIWKKISLHGIGMGGLIAFFAWQQARDYYWPIFLLIPTIIVAGLVGTSRLIRGAHEPSDVYAGYLAGIICQVVAGIAFS